MTPPRGLRGTLLLLLSVIPTATARPQNIVTLTATGAPAFGTPTGTDYAAGAVFNTGFPASGVAYTVQITGLGLITHTATVSIYSTTSTLGNGKPISDLQWACVAACATGTGFSGLTCCGPPGTTIQSQQIQVASNPTAGNTLVFRTLLSYALDAPGRTYTTGAAGIVLLLSVTAP